MSTTNTRPAQLVPKSHQYHLSIRIDKRNGKFGYSIFIQNSVLPIRFIFPTTPDLLNLIAILENRLVESGFEDQLARYIIFHLRTNKKETRTWEYTRL